jgi:hypothetical protein
VVVDTSAVRYAPSAKISARIVDGQLIILRPGNDELLRFNEVASFIWSIIVNKPTSVEHLAQAVVDEFDVELDAAYLDINSFLQEMMNQALVTSD